MNRFVYLVHCNYRDPSVPDAAVPPVRNVSAKVARLPQELARYLGDPEARISGEPTESDPNVIEVTVVTALDEATADAAFVQFIADCSADHPHHGTTARHIRVAAGAAAVKLDRNLGEFNRRFALAVCDVFSTDIATEQSADGKLIFRDRNGRAQVVVHLEDDVLGALNFATSLQHELMIRRLIGNLAAQVRARYDPNQVGEFALRVEGTLKMLA